ncbi:MAG: radical SAM protein [Nitrospina sp.]|jgi:radical SAM protein with 4Fe4S-binding SPASM domain|nr:radical SAM protein [Nitrospina sp.]MBT6716733.1 radical SAM protein [Nitrospina sp.]
MNPTPTLEKEPELDAASVVAIPLNNPKPVRENPLKTWIKKIPFFPAMDYFRRKVYDSSLFDASVRPLAKTLEEWPGALLIDITNRCNAKCVWCPNPDLTNVGAMDMDVYRKIIDDFGTRGGVVTFGTFGEPLMDKFMQERIEYLQRYPKIHKVEVLTNGFFLNDKIAPTLLKYGVGVDISLDELDKQTFEDVKKMSFDVVRENIVSFLEANKKAARPVPVNIRIKTLRTVEETMQQELFKIIASHDCSVVLNSIDDNIISNWAGKLDKDSFVKEFDISTNNKTRFTHKRFNQTNVAPCTQLWKWMVVYWDGSVVLCCADMFSQTVVGDLKKNSITEVWNGPTMKNYRDQMVSRKRFDVAICQDCDIHLSWHNLKEYYDSNGNFLPDRKFIMG